MVLQLDSAACRPGGHDRPRLPIDQQELQPVLRGQRPLTTRPHRLVDAAEAECGFDVPWSLGGGTVLMFRFNHRLSRDIDSSYDASAEAIKPRRPEGDSSNKDIS
ncbi:MAG: nucleotidyl transferase AbiEii/AbiGii toxin family protein [Candidatus Nanopelagicales bacterium]